MATVVITFFLFVRFYVCKMDADCIGDQRDHFLSRREKRWSMNSQRLEEIVALLMSPISSDARRYFDTDLTALLEEYLTEAGLHALDAGDDADAADVVAPNYAELALLLQQSAAIYGRKVDFLYQHVMDVSEALHASALYEDAVEAAPAEEDGPEEDGPDAPGAPAARAGTRAPPRGSQFARTGSQRDPARAAREAGAPRPHPTLPRVFMELEPRVMSEARHALRDYDGEIIGLLDDFQASLELSHSRMLVEDESAAPMDDEQPPLRPISLVELQQAIEAAAPPLLEPLSPASSLPSARSPLHTSTPLPTPDATVALTPPPARRERKRRHDAINIEDITEGSRKILFTEELRRRLLAENRDFSIPRIWINKTVNIRKSDILSLRCELRELEPSPLAGTLGDSGVESPPLGGAARFAEFLGWSAAEAGHAAALVKGGRASADSSDDGFFEQSSVGDGADTRAPDWAAWQAGVLARAAAAERRGLDVRAVGRAVLRALPAPPAPPLHCDHVLRRTARRDPEVSHVLLSTLFLANAGNVHIVAGAPLSVNSFSLQLLSSELPAAEPDDPDDPFLR